MAKKDDTQGHLLDPAWALGLNREGFDLELELHSSGQDALIAADLILPCEVVSSC